MPPHATARPGKPYPLGAAWDGEGVNFSIFSAHAERVLLCFFDSVESDIESRFVELTRRTDQVWHAYVPDIQPGQLYAYRVEGPFNPHDGHRFNGQKVLFDPYARAVGRTLRWDDSVFGFPAVDGLPQSADAVNEMDDRDSAPFAPLSAVADPRFDWRDDRRPNTPWEQTVIYELHVKGFTQQHPGVPEELRGTYRGLASEAAIEHFHKLGVTAVELLPVHHHVDEAHLQKLGFVNYWGYNTLGFFAPEPAYAADPSPQAVIEEFKEMVRGLHAAGIEVLLDVVYNHTCEGNERGPTLCWRGIDNASYYRLQKNRARHVNYTGVGNTVDTRRPQALRMILDSLRYWVEEMHVDGFRFDLCSALGRETDDFDPGSGFFDAAFQDPTLTNVKMIAEPWDIAPSGYRVGGYPTGWSEWNGKYRDTVRDFWRGEPRTRADFAYRFTGSSDLYEATGRRPHASINFITAHDGFTLRDLVSYNEKHNEANGEDNRDGESHNRSWNCGEEGPSDDPEVIRCRARQQRNFLATLFLSQGVPMLLGGDEIGRTQGGNNNAYCQDSEMSWFDWEAVDEPLLEFTRRLIAFRHAHPIFRRKRFFQGRPIRGEGIADITWFTVDAKEMEEGYWEKELARSIAILLRGDIVLDRDERGQPVTDDTFYLVFNGNAQDREVVLPPSSYGKAWELVLDTAAEDPMPAQGWPFQAGRIVPVSGRSILVLRRLD